MNILVVRKSSLGDVVMTTPILEYFKRVLPSCKITFLVDYKYAALLRGHKYIDNLLEIKWEENEKKPFALLKEIIKTVKTLRKTYFDMAFDLQGLFRSALFLYLSKAKKKYARGNWAFLTATLPHKKKLAKHNVEQNYEITSLAGLEKINRIKQNIENSAADIDLSEIANTHLQSFEKVILVNPSARWETKKIPPVTLSQTCNLISEKIRSHFFVLGTTGELQTAKEIYENINAKKTFLCGKLNLNELAGVIKKSALIITADSGPMHMASALNIPLVAVFGPTHPIRTGPYQGEYEIINSEQDCSPCFKRRCIYGHIKCMNDISAEEITKSAIKLLAKQRPVYIN